MEKSEDANINDFVQKNNFFEISLDFFENFKLRDFQMTVRDLLVGIKRNFRKFYKNKS